jgi:hypothetical protein
VGVGIAMDRQRPRDLDVAHVRSRRQLDHGRTRVARDREPLRRRDGGHRPSPRADAVGAGAGVDEDRGRVARRRDERGVVHDGDGLGRRRSGGDEKESERKKCRGRTAHGVHRYLNVY